MDAMVERVAKAIFKTEGYVHETDQRMFEPFEWEELDADDYQVLRNRYRDMARAAIAAMRE